MLCAVCCLSDLLQMIENHFNLYTLYVAARLPLPTGVCLPLCAAKAASHFSDFYENVILKGFCRGLQTQNIS